METIEIQRAPMITTIRLDEAEPSDAVYPPATDAPAGPSATPAPVNILVDLEPGITIHKEPYLVAIPFVAIESGRTKVVVGINAGEARDLTKHDLELVDRLAEAFCWLRDEVRDVAPDQARS